MKVDETPCEGEKYENYIRYGKVVNLENGYTFLYPKIIVDVLIEVY